MAHGYHGRYLRVDVGSGESTPVPLDESTLRQTIGGAGLGCAILLREGAAKIDPLAAKATLVFAMSPLVGSPLTTSAKFAVVSRSPLTGRLNDSLASSGFAIAAKKTGYDAIAVTGIAAELSVVLVDDGIVRVEPVPDLRGRSCSETATLLASQFGPGYQAAVIGPAGENLVHYATISHDGRHAGRGGSGAVLGSKNVKAVLVRGSRQCQWAAPDKLMSLAKSLSERSLGPATAKYRELGTASNLLLFNRLQTLPTRNFQSGSFAEVESIAPETLSQTRERTRAYCAACTIGCEHMYQLGTQSTQRVRVEYENLFALGSLCGVSDSDAVLRGCQLCDEYGIDTISAGGTVAFAMECVERGLLDAPWLKFGDPNAMLRAIEEIGQSTALGKRLSVGSRQLAAEIGHQSIEFAPQVKGLEIPGYEPRGLQHMALGFAVGTRGADHNRSSAYEVDFSTDAQRHELSNQSAQRSAAAEDRAIIMDSLIICKFLRGVFDDFYEETAEMLSAVTGWEVTAEELQETANRIATLRKLFNVHAGWTPAEDTLPNRFFDEPPANSDSPKIDRVAFLQAIREYNLARGWTEEGWVTEEAIAGMGIAEMLTLGATATSVNKD